LFAANLLLEFAIRGDFEGQHQQIPPELPPAKPPPASKLPAISRIGRALRDAGAAAARTIQTLRYLGRIDTGGAVAKTLAFGSAPLTAEKRCELNTALSGGAGAFSGFGPRIPPARAWNRAFLAPLRLKIQPESEVRCRASCSIGIPDSLESPAT
jgi:hypothetical protein